MSDESHTPHAIVSGTGTDTGNGRLVINADDWGRNREVTDKTLDVCLRGTVSSVSAMVFMGDSERAAGIGQERLIDAGLHLNFTLAFDAPHVSPQLMEHQRRIIRYLRSHRLAQCVFHPGLTRSFEYVMSAQIEEFTRLYGLPPKRLDGHHHMHLCANVLVPRLLPPDTLVRRNFSFLAGEKGVVNRYYRRAVDHILSQRHRLTDFFFSLPPLVPQNRLQNIFSLARDHVVEVEAHPINPEEYGFLMGEDVFHLSGGIPVALGFAASPGTSPSGAGPKNASSRMALLILCALPANLDWLDMGRWS